MDRPYDFDQDTRQQAFHRQGGRCACCSGNLKRDYLAREKEVHAHHVTPNQAGRPGNPRDQWLRERDNCVMVCDDCHKRVHENGRYRDGAMAPASYFPHSHGQDRAAHAAWAKQHDRRTDQHYAELRREREQQVQREREVQQAQREQRKERIQQQATASKRAEQKQERRERPTRKP